MSSKRLYNSNNNFQDKYIIQIIIHWNKIPVKTFRKPNQNYTHSLSPRSFFHSNSQYPLNNIPLLSASPPTPSKFVNRAVPPKKKKWKA